MPLFDEAINEQKSFLPLPDENNQDGLQGATPTDPMDSLYRDFLSKSPQAVEAAQTLGLTTSTPSHDSRQGGDSQSEEGSPEPPEHHPAPLLEISRPIGSLRGAEGAGSGRPLTVTGQVATVTDQEIRENRESQEGIRSIPRFRNYQPGKPSRVWPLNLFHQYICPAIHIQNPRELNGLELPMDATRCWQSTA